MVRRLRETHAVYVVHAGHAGCFLEQLHKIRFGEAAEGRERLDRDLLRIVLADIIDRGLNGLALAALVYALGAVNEVEPIEVIEQPEQVGFDSHFPAGYRVVVRLHDRRHILIENVVVRRLGADDARHKVRAVDDGREILDTACVGVRAFENAEIEYDRINDHILRLIPRDRVYLARIDEHDVALVNGEPLVVDTDRPGAFLHLDYLHFLMPVRRHARHFFAYHRAVFRERPKCGPVDFVLVEPIKFLFVEIG